MEPLPLGAGLPSHEEQASDLLRSFRSGDADSLQFIGSELAHLRGRSEQDLRGYDLTGSEAREALAHWYHFATWGDLAEWAEAVVDQSSQVARFEAAVEAIINGDASTLRRLLADDTELIRVRSMREHRATLLVYVGANGVEWYRQKTPQNAVEIAELLLDAGAELDAIGTMYRGTSTLGLVATSVHPVITGVQLQLLQLLIDRGASFDVAVARDYTEGYVVNACLANGRPEAAEFLADHGAPLNLEGAAGVGDLARVREYFDEEGALTPSATAEHLKSAFKWACAYGRKAVVEFLLAKGIDINEQHRGETPLHVAALGGHIDIVDLLLSHGASPAATDEAYESSPLGWALWGWSHPAPEWKDTHHYDVVARLVTAGSPVEPEWLASEADPRMRAALSGNT